MNFRNVTYDQLTDAEITAWSAIQRSHAEFSSPFFRPAFTRLVAFVRPDVEVAVLEEAGAPVGFFPFQRTFFNAGWPVGSGVNDYHGLIAPPDVQCDPCELLHACRLSSWHFDHLVPVHAPFKSKAWSAADSPYIDLRDGFDSYLRSRENGSRIMADYRRKKRRIEREVGPLRYEPHVSTPAVLATCIRWKVQQYRRTGVVNIFKYSWTAKLLHSILDYHSRDFASAMPVCYAGDRIVAVNFGMRSGDVFHSWFPAYDAELAQYSPGLLHFVEMMKAAKSQGINRIVLGKGDESYKKRLMNGADRVAQGCVDMRQALGTVRRTWKRMRKAIKASPLRRPARVPGRIANRIATWLAFR